MTYLFAIMDAHTCFREDGPRSKIDHGALCWHLFEMITSNKKDTNSQVLKQRVISERNKLYATDEFHKGTVRKRPSALDRQESFVPDVEPIAGDLDDSEEDSWRECLET